MEGVDGVVVAMVGGLMKVREKEKGKSETETKMKTKIVKVICVASPTDMLYDIVCGLVGVLEIAESVREGIL